MAEFQNPLIRGLTLTDTTSLVIGTIIGTGVFLKTTVMAQQVDTPSLVLAAWVAAGALSMAGALTYAELGAMLPQAGGEYVYLRTAYGDLVAFLYGWTTVAIIAAGSIAALGVAFATFLSAIFPIGKPWVACTFHIFGHELLWNFGLKQVIAVTVILVFSVINCAGVVFGGRVQLVFTIARLLAIAAIVIGVFLFSKSATWSNLTTGFGMHRLGGLKGFGAAMLAALWAYNGWNCMPMVAGEVRDPGRNVPRALIIGMVIVIVVYGMANLAYFYALPFREIATSNSVLYPDALPVATKAAQTFIGTLGTKLVTTAFLLSIMGGLQGVIMVYARIPFAMALHGLFLSTMGTVSKGTSAPVWAIGIQAGWACVMADFRKLRSIDGFCALRCVGFLWIDGCLGLRAEAEDAQCGAAVPHARLPRGTPHFCARCHLAGH